MFLGIDTSNYTTSVSLYNYDNNETKQIKRLLTVKDGELGLRQSDAVFLHVKQLGELITDLINNKKIQIDAIGVSTRPRDNEYSYMPCFMVGKMVAESISACTGSKLYTFSHQQGHIISVLYSANKLNLLNNQFIAFHLSGGTTEAVLVSPSKERIIETKLIAKSLDLKAGQAVDRVGKMLELPFPSGKYIEELALKSNKVFSIKPSIRNLDCSLSGLENKCQNMLLNGEKKEDIALYCIKSIESALDQMTNNLLSVYGDIPVIYSGGVMSNSIIRSDFENKYNGIFAEPVYSTDNATGIAVLASLAFHKSGDNDE